MTNDTESNNPCTQTFKAFLRRLTVAAHRLFGINVNSTSNAPRIYGPDPADTELALPIIYGETGMGKGNIEHARLRAAARRQIANDRTTANDNQETTND